MSKWYPGVTNGVSGVFKGFQERTHGANIRLERCPGDKGPNVVPEWLEVFAQRNGMEPQEPKLRS